MVFRLVGIALFLGATSSLYAQEAFNAALRQSANRATSTINSSESAWIDLRQHLPVNSTPQSAPRWVEAVSLNSTTTTNNGNAKSIFRIRIARPSGNYRVLFFRLFFDDQPNAQPELIAWDESGSQVLRSGPLGAGIGVATSDSVVIPMMGASTIDIEVPGDGKTVRGAYLDWMSSDETVHPLSAEHRDVIPEPFSSVPPLHVPKKDVEQFGTVVGTPFGGHDPYRTGDAGGGNFSVWNRIAAARRHADFRNRQSTDRFAARDLSERQEHRRCLIGFAGPGRSRLSRRNGTVDERDAFPIYRMAPGAENCASEQLETGKQRIDYHERPQWIGIGDPGNPDSAQVSLGKIGLLAPTCEVTGQT